MHVTYIVRDESASVSGCQKVRVCGCVVFSVRPCYIHVAAVCFLSNKDLVTVVTQTGTRGRETKERKSKAKDRRETVRMWCGVVRGCVRAEQRR